MKKVYEKPTLATRVVALGVFGNYNGNGIDPDGGGGRGGSLPHPAKIITDRRFHME